MKEVIIQEGSEVLRQLAKAVPLADITAPTFVKLVAKMKKVLASAHDGVALAAPQIGGSWQIFVVSPKAFEEENLDIKAPKNELVFINPVITRNSRSKREMVEGCLSVRGIYGTTKRHERVSVEAYDETGRKFVRHASGLMAQIFQHEIDHLKGILFIDTAKGLHEVVDDHDHKHNA